ncbi:MAG: adenylate/guanylate cyclase domain-containing protein [Salinivirgaceae bacterium]
MTENTSAYRVIIIGGSALSLTKKLKSKNSRVSTEQVGNFSEVPENTDLLLVLENLTQVEIPAQLACPIWASSANMAPEEIDVILPTNPDEEYLAEAIHHHFNYSKNAASLSEEHLYSEKTVHDITQELQEVNEELKSQSDKLNKKHSELMQEKERTDELLHNILPEIVAHQLKKGKKKPKRHKSVTVMFADFKGFTKICNKHDPQEIVSTLDELFSKFDSIIEKHFIEKIKTIGDAYMCAGGMPMKNNSHAVNIVMAALEIQHYLFEYNKPRMLHHETVWECRIGIHSGEVFAGVVGQRKFAYDIWGNTVNLAARMETAGAVNSVNISETTYEFVKDYFDCIPRGEIEVKNVGKANMFFVNGLKPEYASDASGVFPNAEFEKILRSL